MTFASSCTKEEAFRIMDRAVDGGIDFFDTAEVYPVPPKETYVHTTEEIVGEWLSRRNRDSILIATKVCGPGHGWFSPPVRSGKTALDRHHIITAIEGSLRRLKTDYIDLYQTHWPDHDFGYEETLAALDELVLSGKVRIVGSSNETPWGTMKSLATAETGGTVRYETIQNNFSILNRRFEDALADICRREQISLLPYSPVAGGVLSGKYNAASPPENARFSKYMREGEVRQRLMANRFLNEKTLAATARLLAVAADAGLDPVTMAVAWSKQHDFVASTIIGANSVEQLEASLKAADLTLDLSVLKRIDEVSMEVPYPMG